MHRHSTKLPRFPLAHLPPPTVLTQELYFQYTHSRHLYYTVYQSQVTCTVRVWNEWLLPHDLFMNLLRSKLRLELRLPSRSIAFHNCGYCHQTSILTLNFPLHRRKNNHAIIYLCVCVDIIGNPMVQNLSVRCFP